MTGRFLYVSEIPTVAAVLLCQRSIGLCVRRPDTLVEDRQSCPIFFRYDNVSKIIDEMLTPGDIVNVSKNHD